jgi:hypothetical protein
LWRLEVEYHEFAAGPQCHRPPPNDLIVFRFERQCERGDDAVDRRGKALLAGA